MSSTPEQGVFPGLETPHNSPAEEGIPASAGEPAKEVAFHSQPDERVSAAQADLGGLPHELTDDQARALHNAGLGGGRVTRRVARADTAAYLQRSFNLTGPMKLSDEQIATNVRGHRRVTRALAPFEFDRASHDADGDQSRLMALQRARAEKRERDRKANS